MEQFPVVESHRPGLDTAWEDRELREGWAAHKRVAWLFLFAALVLAALAALLIVQTVTEDAALLRNGVSTPGVVTGGAYLRRGSDSVRVRYRAHGQEHEGNLFGPGPGDLPKGSRLTVIYDRDDPDRFRTRDNANHDDFREMGTVGLPVGAVVFGVGAVVSGLRLLRWRRWMRSSAAGVWTVRAVSEAEKRNDGIVVALVGARQDGNAVEVVAKVASGWISPLRDVRGYLNDRVRVVPGSRGRRVMSVPGIDRLFQVRLPSRQHKHRDWASRLEPISRRGAPPWAR